MQKKYLSFSKALLFTGAAGIMAFAFFTAQGQTASPVSDIRLGVRVYGGSCGANPDKASQEIGITQFTPWANSGGGQSPAAFNPKKSELHCEQVKLEARTPALPVGKDIRFGVQLSDNSDCARKIGVTQYTPWASEGGGTSEWAKDGGSSSPGFDDPNCASVIVETRDKANFVVEDIRLGAQAGNGSGKAYCTRVRTQFNQVTTPWASEGGGWSGITGAGGTNPECLRIELDAKTAMTTATTTPTSTPPVATPLLRVLPSSWRFQVGDTKDLEARYYRDTTNEPAIFQNVTIDSAWNSDDVTTVSVISPGKIQGEKIGNTIVHAKYKGLDATSTIEVYYEEEPPPETPTKKLLDSLREILPRF